MRIFLLILICMTGLSYSSEMANYNTGSSVQDHYAKLVDAYQKGESKTTIALARKILSEYRGTTFANESYYYLAMANYKQGEYALSNHYLDKYLKTNSAPRFFEEAIRTKFDIAVKFQQGERKHMFGWNRLPKVMSAQEEALVIFDEIIASMPRDDMAAQALFKKGNLLKIRRDYKLGVEALQTLIRRFPKHELAPEAYLGIAAIYKDQCANEFADPDLLDLAEVNVKKFEQDYPLEPRLVDAYTVLTEIKEKFAGDMFEMGFFYERTKKKDAAILYYSNIIARYPTTPSAKKSAKRLEKLQVKNEKHRKLS